MRLLLAIIIIEHVADQAADSVGRVTAGPSSRQVSVQRSVPNVLNPTHTR